MNKYGLFFLLTTGCAYTCIAQKDTIVNRLKEVKVFTKKVTNTAVLGIKSVEIGAHQIIKNPENLTNLLRYNSPIVFRDYGNGGTSTARFRGTSPTNTLVLWNGIPINAVGSGQTDFNALSANTFDEIVIHSGGGSVNYGSGAIGGVVHLNDKLQFKKDKQFQVFTSLGSFFTSATFAKAHLANKKFVLKLAATHNSSKNDYVYIDERFKDNNGNLFKNENGNYSNYSINLSTGYQFSSTNKVFFYTTKYYGNRFFSDGLPNPAAATERNEDFNQRNLFNWQLKIKNLKQAVHLAYLTQEFRYYNDKNSTFFDFGKSQNSRFDYDLSYTFSNQLKTSFGFVYDAIIGTTATDLEKIKNVRKAATIIAKLNYNPFQNLKTNFSLRNEHNSDFKVPLAWSFASEFKWFPKLELLVNVSSNYRVPTFNELYWPLVGNKSLVPEQSIQGELGFSYKNKFVALSTTFFYIDIANKVVWLPTLGSNLWRPLNVDNALHKGVELFLKSSYELGAHHFNFSSNYTFANAKDSGTGAFLPFSPQHLFNFNMDYNYKKIHFYLQHLYQSKVFTNQINIDFYALTALSVTNLGTEYTLLKTIKKHLTTGFRINNVLNKLYYFSNLRPMPGTNFNIHINYKF